MIETLLNRWQDSPDIKVTKPLATGEGVLDQAAFDTIEVDKLFEAVNHAATTTGQAVLYRSLTQPLDDINAIQAKQTAVEELRDHPELMAALDNMIQTAARHEKNFYLLLFGEFLGTFGTARHDYEIEGYGYLHYKRGIRLMKDLVAQIQAAPQPNSPYLIALFDKIKAFSHSRAYSLMTASVYITEKGIQSKQERKGSFLPAVIFKPRLFKPILITLMVAIFLAVTEFIAIPDEFLLITPLLLVYIPLVGGFDRDSCIIPLRNEFRLSSEVADTLDALGQLDELLSFIKFSIAFGHDVVLPTLIMGEHHQINLQDAKNPVLAKENPSYVGNDFVLEDDKLVLITGPNSGGKTAFCKTITQIQVLAQIGCFVPAQAATLTVADRIFYQVSEISHLNDGEGRFGTELKRTKDIFLASTAQSLVVLDELSEGTTFEEKMEASSNVLNGFYRKGNSTVLITHNHKLVDQFARKKIGIPKQVEFANDAPTYKLIAGISRVSHADRVAKKIGFSKEDIDNYLAGKK
jgi:DNA mismatch repair protein MutS